MAKIEPAVTQLAFLVPDGTSYIDLAKSLSKVNRRMYRQGYTYVIQDIQAVLNVGNKPSDVTYMSLSTMGNSWIVQNAWKKGFKTWQKMQNEFLDGDGARLKGKWADFKIYLDDSMAAGTVLEPISGDGAAYAAGEWVYSNFVYDDAGTSRSPAIHMIGTSTADSAIGLIQAYGESRNAPSYGPTNPTALNTGFYAEFHGVGDIDDELGEDIENDNDVPPYDRDNYAGGDTNADASVPVRIITVNGNQASSTAGGFIVPCGLLKIESAEYSLVDPNDVNTVYAETTAATTAIIVTLAAGPYRGVLAAPMGQ